MKKRWKLIGKIIPAVVLLGLGASVFFVGEPVFFRAEAQIDRYIKIAEQLNIKNVVSAIYLGPRLADTLIEVLVVVATVFGMIFIRKNQ